MNEEDLKNEVVVPLLRTLGFSAGSLRFEKSFSLRLGHGVYNVEGTPTSLAKGRLDILCTVEGKSLCVVELKAPGIAVSEEDKRQGLSYARLLDHIAPFVLITNGDKTVLLDTYTGAQIEPHSGAWTGEYGFSLGLDDEVRMRCEALATFIGLSYANLLSFCEASNEATLRKFRAATNEPRSAQLQKKYLPDLYVHRVVDAQFNSFLEQTRWTVFPIIGESGVGKTNTACYLTEAHRNIPILFRSGTILGASLLKEIADAFNIVFSSQESDIALLKKISVITSARNTSLILIIDAIDEWIAPDKGSQLSDCVRAFRSLGLKLCVSCNTLVWEGLLTRNGVTTDLAEGIFPGVVTLKAFTPTETSAAIHRYSTFLGLKQAVGSPIATGAINPFVLRVACEVAHSSGEALDINGETRTSIERYITLKCEKAEDPQYLKRLLLEITKLHVATGEFSLSESTIRQMLRLPIHEALPADLYTLGFLVRYEDAFGVVYTAFYFSAVRDYLVSIIALEFGRADLMLSAIVDALSNPIGQSAVAYFLKTGSENEQKQCVDAFSKAGNDIAVRMLAWFGESIRPNVKASCVAEALALLKRLISNPVTTPLVAEQCLRACEHFADHYDKEQIAAEWMQAIAMLPSGGSQMIASKLAAALKCGNNPLVTECLFRLAKDKAKDGYVRRYVIEALYERQFPERTDTFLELIQDPVADVRNWVRSWYRQIETEDIRNRLVQLLDGTSGAGIKQDVLVSLGDSSLVDTGDLLADRLATQRDEGPVLWWLCRTLGFLQHRRSLPKMLNLLRETKDSELVEHILITLGDLGQREFTIDVLRELIVTPRPEISEHWIVYAFTRVASEEDYHSLVEVLEAGKSKSSGLLAASLLAQRFPIYGRTSLWNVLAGSVFTGREKYSVLHFLFRGLQERNGTDQQDSFESQESHDRGALVLEQLIGENTEASTSAFWGLFVFVRDDRVLEGAIKRLLPRLNRAISSRELLLSDLSRLQKMAPSLREWIYGVVARERNNRVLLANLLELIGMFGDDQGLEVIARNRPKLVTACCPGRVEFVENLLRTSREQVRVMF